MLNLLTPDKEIREKLNEKVASESRETVIDKSKEFLKLFDTQMDMKCGVNAAVKKAAINYINDDDFSFFLSAPTLEELRDEVNVDIWRFL